MASEPIYDESIKYVDPGIKIDVKSIQSILEMFPQETCGNMHYHYTLMHQNKKCIRLYNYQGTIEIYEEIIEADESPTKYTINVTLCAPSLIIQGLTSKDVDNLWIFITLLEKDGWTYEQEIQNDNEDCYFKHHHPPVEYRPKFIDLLKKVYTIPMTKRAI